ECLQMGWLRVVDKMALREVRTRLRAEPGIGPVYGLPRVGDVDFTLAGARLYRRIIVELYGSSFIADRVLVAKRGRKEYRFTKTYRTALRELAKLRHESGGVAREVLPIGRWYVYWWDRYATGYCITGKRKMHRNPNSRTI